ncbi:MAG: 5'-methylthioadenosine/S-adenosylhomocysteine nucleosidase [Bacteroidota bacterium]
MIIAILTPIQIEQAAIISQLHHTSEKIVDGNRYIFGKLDGLHHSFNIITQQSGPKNEVTAIAAEKIIRIFQPIIVLLVGVAGGVKDVAIGDVVVGTKYYGYESGKENPEGFASRPDSGYYSKELLVCAEFVAAKNAWHQRTEKAKNSKVIFGAIASGNKVIAATDSATFRLLKQNYNDTTAVDMEAVGLGQVMRLYPSIRFLNIRGISDLLDHKSAADASGSQELAAANMAAFVIELINQIDISKFKITGMEIHELAKQIVELIIPIAKSESTKEITGEVKAVTEGSMNQLWEKVKPLFMEEYLALKKKPNDKDTRSPKNK